jgi:lipocalin
VFEFYQLGSECVRATYTDLGNEIGVFNEQINSLTGNYGNVKGSARPAQRSGEFIVGFSNIPFGGGGGGNTPNYRVVDTDYSSYAIVYNCNPFLGFLKKESLWLLTRAQFPSKYLVSNAYRKMDQLGLPRRSLAKTPQNKCSKLPAPGSANFQLSLESLG